MELASRYPFGLCNFEVAPIFLEKIFTPDLSYSFFSQFLQELFLFVGTATTLIYRVFQKDFNDLNLVYFTY